MPRLAAATTLLVLLLAAPARAAAPPDDLDAKHLRAVRTARPPRIDGRLDEPEWAEAPAASDFTQRYPDEGTPPSERTEVRVLFDDAALYVGIRCFDRHPAAIARFVSRRDQVPESDSVTVSIDSLHDHTTARAFKVNAAGVQGDSMLYNDTESNDDWDAVWDAEVSVDDAGWSVEIAIPWRALPCTRGQRLFGFDVARNLFGTKEISGWVYTPRSQRSGVSRFGHLEISGGFASAQSLELVPWVGAWVGHEAGDVHGGGSAGLDLRYALTPDLRLDITANPDFGQVEADPAMLNLTTFELFYPEKRAFFLEGAHLFQPPIPTQTMQLFYSRRIGKKPDDPSLADGETLIGVGPPAPIAGAAKLTGQLAKGWNIAALEAVTLPTEAIVERADGGREQRVLLPTTNYTVLRAARDLPGGAVGATFTSVRPFEGNLTSCPSGEAPVDGRCTRGAETFGLDVRLRPGDYLIAAQVVASRLAQGPDLAIADGTTIHQGDAGIGGQLRVAKESGENFLFSLDAEYESPKLDLNEAGYLERQNNLYEHGRAVLRTLEPHWIARESEAAIDLRARQTGSLKRLWEDAQLSADATFTNFWSAGLGGHVTDQGWDPRDLRDGAFLWRPPLVGGWIWLATDGRKPFYIEGDVYGARGLDDSFGKFQEYGCDARAVIRPAPRWETTLGFNYDRTWDSMRYIDVDVTSYHVAPIDTRSASVTLRQMLALTPRLVLQGYAQLFFASGSTTQTFVAPVGMAVEPGVPSYDYVEPPGPWFHDGQLNVTVVLRWEFLPGSTAYLVYQRAQTETAAVPNNGVAPIRDLNTLGAGRTDDRVLLKVAWWLGV
jgi:hypothetical protein